MKLLQRPYQPGDEVGINKLYKLITGRERSDEQYRWEWVHTWCGQGSIWLAFDEDRAPDDQLIMQYSLIPTPFSVRGESYLAGKTENCMSHPDLRGKGHYFLHEQKYFEEAKKRFQIFFTTTGNVARGAPGAVRRKLGYKAFDSWVNLSFQLNKLPAYNNNGKSLLGKTWNGILPYIRNIRHCYCSLFIPKQTDPNMIIMEEHQAPLMEIEQLWEKNKYLYGITVERTSKYLHWRINKNPYFQHKYLLYRQGKSLKGYVIFCILKGNILKIVDIFADDKDERIFKSMLKQLIFWAVENQMDVIQCLTSSKNLFLRRVFSSCGFLPRFNISRFMNFYKTNLSQRLPFHVFISDSVVNTHPDILNTGDWYMTELVFEGRAN